MKQIVNRFIKKHQLLKSDATVVVGVSGGPDSLALLHFLKNVKHYKNLTLIATHVNHMLRGEEADQDFLFVEHFCKGNLITFEGTKVDVKKYQEEHKVSSQVAARECRYQFFQDIMVKYSADYLALAHHGDDQVETVLMRQVRGAYGSGLAGIPVRRPFSRGEVIRPFLCVSKEEINAYCQSEKLTPRIDRSNFSSKYLRNRIRNEILPVLKKENPSVHLRFQQQSELLLEDENFLEQLSQKEINEAIVEKGPNKVVLSISRFNNSPVPLQRRGFQLILNYLYCINIPEITTIHIDDFLSFMKNSYPSGYLHFPNGLLIKKSYDECRIQFNKVEQFEDYQILLPVPGIVNLKKGMIIGEEFDTFPDVIMGKNIIVCDKDKLAFPLKIRNRKNGDRLSIKGINGTKKLKDLFIDEKVAREKRDHWPILVDDTDTIIWIPGIRHANIAVPSKDTKKFLLISFKEGSDKC